MLQIWRRPVCTWPDDTKVSVIISSDEFSSSEVRAQSIFTQTLFMWIQLEGPCIIVLKCLFVLNLYSFLICATPMQPPLCLRGEKNIHSQNTFICGSLYTCEIRACWTAVSMSKQLKQIQNSIKTLLDLRWHFQGRSDYFLHFTQKLQMQISLWLNSLFLIPKLFEIYVSLIMVYQKVFYHNQKISL